MLVAMTGAHLGGKKSLAEAFAQKMHCNVVQPDIEEVYDQYGYDIGGAMQFSERLRVQQSAISLMANLIRDAIEPAVFTRSPVDLTAYMTADYIGLGLSPLEIQQLAEYHAIALSPVYCRAIDVLVVCHPHADNTVRDDPTLGDRDADYLRRLDEIITITAFQLAMYTRVVDIPASLPPCEHLAYLENNL